LSRSGTSTNTFVNVRFIFATNAIPEEEIGLKHLREDFFHRINVLRINVPPLRERMEDIPLLIEYFAERTEHEGNIASKTFSNGATDMLLSFRWPGNVRELKNLVERLIITTDKDVIDAEDIELPGTKHLKEFSEMFNRNMSLNDFQNESEKIFLLKMLNDYKYNISQTASALQIQRSHLYKLMTKYNIPTPSKIKEN
jgi:two-component system nitrogen regulation response regulator NtrX